MSGGWRLILCCIVITLITFGLTRLLLYYNYDREITTDQYILVNNEFGKYGLIDGCIKTSMDDGIITYEELVHINRLVKRYIKQELTFKVRD